MSSTYSTAASTPRPGLAAPLVSQFEAECVQFFAEVVQLFGVPKSVGQIYGLLYASPQPLGFPDIVERLEISKGSASQGLQVLRELGAINVASSNLRVPSPKLPSSLKVVYEPELSLRRLVNGVLRERIAPMAASSTERLNRLRSLGREGGAASDFYSDRAKQLGAWRRRLKAVLPVLGAFLGPKS